MFHSREINNKINNLHERALRIAYKDTESSFEELLVKDNSVSMHHRNIQRLATEPYKDKNMVSLQKVLQKYLLKETCDTISEDNRISFYPIQRP